MTSATDRLGTILRDQDRLGLRFVRHLRHSPERVWRALTDREQLRHWFPTDIVGDRVEDAELEMPFWPAHVEQYGLEEVAVTHGRLRAWDPPRVLELSWEHELLRYEVEPDGEGSVLTLTVWLGDPLAHGPDGSPDEATGTASAAAGYHTCLEHLEALLDERDLGPLHQADSEALRAEYRAMV